MFVPIGGIQQWITIHGSDTRNPVLLVVHEGPADPLSPYAKNLFAGWDKDFIMVQWDQRGAGRTYGKTGPSIEATMTLDRMVQDGIEVTQYLTQHLSKKKIILTGGSWGSILGIMMAHARPDLFYACLGDSQELNWWKDVETTYPKILRMAEAANDEATVQALRSLGPPPLEKTLSRMGHVP